MSDKTADKANEITYHWEGEYLIPDLAAPQNPNLNYGKWSDMRYKYLKEYHKVLYTNLLTKGTLPEHLSDVQTRAEEMFDRLMTQMREREGLTEQFKKEHQMEWVQGMNNLKSRVTEIICEEIIYAPV